MRDPNRIDSILQDLGEIWKKYPDMRLGQLISNLDAETPIYYTGDKALINELKRYYHIGEKNDTI